MSQSTRAYGDRQSLATKDEMDGNAAGHPKRRAADPIAKLEKAAGRSGPRGAVRAPTLS